jgi:hypothetical protein
MLEGSGSVSLTMDPDPGGPKTLYTLYITAPIIKDLRN